MKVRKYYIFGKFLFVLFFLLLLPKTGFASSVYLSPASGTFYVGSTFNVSVLVDTQGKSINALQVFLSFPPDKLQVVSPSTGQSIVDVWTVPPKFNNNLGTINLEGGIPRGIFTSKGILTTITFRVKAIGDSVVKFLDKSRVYLNDGLATDSLGSLGDALYNLKLPPPQGPLVFSDTHKDQFLWYPDTTATLHFIADNPVEGYSYVLSRDADTIPDNISEGTKTSVSYSNLSDGLYYFNVKALRDGVWGGTTHFMIRVDTAPPAEFSVNILPSSYTTNTTPIVKFETTDASSGLDHFEVKLEPLSIGAIHIMESGVSNFFVESESPYILSPLTPGSYDVIVRAYDKAGNFREVTKRLVITTPIFEFIGDQGIIIDNLITVPWKWVWIVGISLLIILLLITYKAFSWHNRVHALNEEKKLPPEVVQKLDELKKYREKYGAKMLVSLFIILSLFSFHNVKAEILEVAPPLITDLSKDISNKEIFYAGGKTNIANETVILYLQDLLTGETTSETIQSDKNGDWFYRHTNFLAPGDYLLWTQGKLGEQFSPPSPQINMTVKQTAIVFGQNRLSYELIYLFAVIILLIIISILVFLIIYNTYHGRKKHKKFKKVVREAEESIHRGFAVLRRDIEAELAILRRAGLSESLSAEEKDKETQLLEDLNAIQKHVGKEIWDMNKDSQ